MFPEPKLRVNPHRSLLRLMTAFFLLCSLFAAPAAFAQSGRQVTGKVISEKDDPLQAVTVSVKGSTQATTTDVNGNFRLNVPNGATLVFSSVGFVNQEIAFTGQSTVAVRLSTTSRTLNEDSQEPLTPAR
jgi:hypothetical protein